MAFLIAVIDDSEVILEWTREHLERVGFSVVTHNSGFGINSFIADNHPDLVLLDIKMPGVTGDVLCKMIKQSADGWNVRILLYSSMPEQQLAEATDRCGADGYIKKTDNPNTLTGYVKVFLASFLR